MIWLKNVPSVKQYLQNLFFIRIERRWMVIDHLVNFVVRSIIMIIKIKNFHNKKIYKKNNQSKINAYERLKRKTDFNFKLLCNIRKRTNKAFKSQNIEKTIKTIGLIGCSISFLRKWIIHQLCGEMTLGNYGKIWCLDHCYPLSKTNLSNEIDMYNSTNWINLRPMYKKDNIVKSDKIDNRLYSMQEVKAKYFLKLKEVRLN